MTKENVNTVVFFSSSLFCSIWNDADGVYGYEEAIARYLNVPEEHVLDFALAFATSWNGLFLNKGEREKKFTRENVAEFFGKTQLRPIIKTLGVTSEQVVQAMERTEIYTYNKLENYSEVLSTLEYLYEKYKSQYQNYQKRENNFYQFRHIKSTTRIINIFHLF